MEILIKNLNMKSNKKLYYLLIICYVSTILLQSCSNMRPNDIAKTNYNILENAFIKYGAPVAIGNLCIHQCFPLYEYQSPKLYSVLKNPKDTVIVNQIVFKNENNKLIIWTTMKNDSLVVIDELEYNYHNIRY